MSSIPIRLDNIQGNIFGGFNKDFQDFLFLKVIDPDKACKWVRKNSKDLISTSTQVLAFNNTFKSLRKSGVPKPESIITARWTNIAFSFKGLKALGFKKSDFGPLPTEFSVGMAARNKVIGDVGASDPQKWQAPFGRTNRARIHAVLLLAADTEEDLNIHVDQVTNKDDFLRGFAIVKGGTIHGRTRVDNPGHEHFGFKDGVSQPGIRGVNRPDDPLANANQGHPGQDLLWPGEFVLGYPTQIPTAKSRHDGPNPDPGPVSTAGNPDWTKDGSFMVFRRLQQNVPAFHEQLATLARANDLSVDLMGAKLVGRYKSGCPLEALSMQPNPAPPSSTDPGLSDPALADNDTLNNAFEFGDDVKGVRCPLGAHIRKAYPRDENTGHGNDSESNTQTRRLLRRGIPYGNSFGAANQGGPKDKRGLLFLSYQKDIGKQFEFVQKKWVNDPKFPPEIRQTAHVPGQDPIIAQSTRGPFELKPRRTNIDVKHFVTTTGGEYFFAPSLDTLKKRF